MPTVADQAGLELLGRAGMVAVPLAALRSPARAGLGKDGRTALVAGGSGRVRGGDLVVWCKPVVVAPAVVRRDGRVQAAGHPVQHARLGVAEDRLDALTGSPGVIEELAGSVALRGRKVKGVVRRVMTVALAIRFVLLMTLMPAADYPEVMAVLLGDLVVVPWQRPYRLPTATVATTWRQALDADPLRQLRDRLLAGVDAEHHDQDCRVVRVGELDTCSIDGSLIRLPGGVRWAAVTAQARIEPPASSNCSAQKGKAQVVGAGHLGAQAAVPQREPVWRVGHRELGDHVQPPGERVVQVGPQVRGEHRDPVEGFHALQQERGFEVGVAILRVLDLGALTEDRVGRGSSIMNTLMTACGPKWLLPLGWVRRP